MAVPSPTSAVPPAAAHDQAWTLVFLAWLVAAASTLGALFFSEVMKVPPCELCWWQRVFMIPLVFILPAGLFPFDPRLLRYALPLAAGGWAFAAFHWLLVLGLIPENIQPCVKGIPCDEVTLEWLGFINIPLLSLFAFSTILALLALTYIKAPK